jgi:ligand-binding sensor domain-containing protein/signal transduction histidine kinase
VKTGYPSRLVALVCALAAPRCAPALNPAKALTQYSRTVWTQAQGLPQDTVRAITQTPDGYLWVGTDEGLARFDGYEFAVFTKDRGELPGDSVTALAAAADGTLWIGTSDGLARYQNRRFQVFTTREGLPDNGVTALAAGRDGSLWIVAGVYLSRLRDGRFTHYAPGKDVPLGAVRTVTEDRRGRVWIGGYGGVARLEGERFVPAFQDSAPDADVAIGLVIDRRDNLWIAGTQGLLQVPPGGAPRRFGVREGLPDPFVRSLWEDRDGNLWAGTNRGLSRLENSRFVAPSLEAGGERDWVRSIFEDREGNLWVGMNSGLRRLRDDVFTVFAEAEGLPGDQPTVVYQDRAGRMWIGFHESGLVEFGARGFRRFTTRNGLLSNEVFSIREDRRGGLLVATREGLSRLEGERFRAHVPSDPAARRVVFDALEDRAGRLWLATPSGLWEVAGGRQRNAIPGGPLLNTAVVVLAESRDGAIWAGTYGKGLWRYAGNRARLFSAAEGLPGEQIRALLEDRDGTLWIGTFGAGLVRLRDGRFTRYSSRDGLLSDNIAHVEDDGEGWLWLSTTRGICRVPRRELEEFAGGRIKVLKPVNYGVEDGLRSAQCAPGYPTGGGAFHARDGRLWFPTTRGLAVLDPHAPPPLVLPPLVQLVDVRSDGRSVDPSEPARLPAGEGRLLIRYTGIHLSAPERVRYSYRLEGVDKAWVSAVSRRLINYNNLSHGRYRFAVRAEVAGAAPSETAWYFQLLPHFYETWWFRALCLAALAAAARAAWELRLRAVRGRFALVLEERARLAREIHDTLAQGFVGISSQLDAVAMCMPPDEGPARRALDLAGRMARHSLTEARRSVMDLRASELEGQDLAAALEAGAGAWTAGSSLEVRAETSGTPRPLPSETQQHLLRIAQEAVTNAVKHAGAGRVSIQLRWEAGKVFLSVADDGHGFLESAAFSAPDGHFGLLGMRERAVRAGGELRLESRPGGGTRVEVEVPAP